MNIIRSKFIFIVAFIWSLTIGHSQETVSKNAAIKDVAPSVLPGEGPAQHDFF